MSIPSSAYATGTAGVRRTDGGLVYMPSSTYPTAGYAGEARSTSCLEVRENARHVRKLGMRARWTRWHWQLSDVPASATVAKEIQTKHGIYSQPVFSASGPPAGNVRSTPSASAWTFFGWFLVSDPSAIGFVMSFMLCTSRSSRRQSPRSSIYA